MNRDIPLAYTLFSAKHKIAQVNHYISEATVTSGYLKTFHISKTFFSSGISSVSNKYFMEDCSHKKDIQDFMCNSWQNKPFPLGKSQNEMLNCEGGSVMWKSHNKIMVWWDYLGVKNPIIWSYWILLCS